jgi:hypothetical protein
MTDFGLAIHFTLQAAGYESLAIQNCGIGWNFRAEAGGQFDGGVFPLSNLVNI